MLGNQNKIVSQLYDATQLKNLCLLFIPTALQIASCTPYETLPFPPRFCSSVRLSSPSTDVSRGYQMQE